MLSRGSASASVLALEVLLDIRDLLEEAGRVKISGTPVGPASLRSDISPEKLKEMLRVDCGVKEGGVICRMPECVSCENKVELKKHEDLLC